MGLSSSSKLKILPDFCQLSKLGSYKIGDLYQATVDSNSVRITMSQQPVNLSTPLITYKLLSLYIQVQIKCPDVYKDIVPKYPENLRVLTRKQRPRWPWRSRPSASTLSTWTGSWGGRGGSQHTWPRLHGGGSAGGPTTTARSARPSCRSKIVRSGWSGRTLEWKVYAKIQISGQIYDF